MTREAPIEPGRPIIDPHHHLWDFRSHIGQLQGHPLLDVVRHTPLYRIEDLQRDAQAGHDIRATVYVECGSHHLEDGPVELRPVGEVRLVARTLDAELDAGRGRLRGLRQMAAHDADAAVLGPTGHVPAGLLRSDDFRRGFRHLRPRGLVFDAWVLEPQLADVVDLARAFPGVSIVVDHTGSPVDIASYRGRLAERFPAWAASRRRLAACPNVHVKLGGLGNPIGGAAEPGAQSSERLAERWRPYIEYCIEVFGSRRCMFESNFPVDRWVGDYVTLWNAFKRITAGASAAEKGDLFFDTAARVYRLEVKAAAAAR